MTLTEACKSAREGNFVSHEYFDDNQSMHSYNNDLYYEDGANLTIGSGLDFIKREEWAKNGWSVKYTKDKVNTEKLDNMHKQYGSRMLPYGISYEDCIK